MTTKQTLAAITTLPVLLAGCASNLTVAGHPLANEDPYVGIPVATSMTVIERFELTEHSTGEACKDHSAEQLVSIASGQVYYINLDASEFGTSSLAINLHPNGTLDTLSLNSTPAPAQVATALETVAGVVLPVIGLGPAADGSSSDSGSRGQPGLTNEGGEEAPQTREDSKLLCDAGKRIICYERLDGSPIGLECPLEPRPEEE